MDIVHGRCKGTDIPIKEETRVGGPLSFKVLEMEKSLTGFMKNLDAFRLESEKRWSIEEARKLNAGGVGGRRDRWFSILQPSDRKDCRASWSGREKRTAEHPWSESQWCSSWGSAAYQCHSPGGAGCGG